MIRFSLLSKLFVAAFLLLSSQRAGAQSVQRLTPAQAVAKALASNKELEAARGLIVQARARGEVSGRLDNPEISFDYSTDWAFNDEGESSLGIGFSQRFPVTKRISILKRIAEDEISMAEEEVRNRERLVVREIELLCNEFAYLESQLELRRSLVAIDREFEAFVVSRVEAAEASPVDLNQIRIELFALQQEMGQLAIDRDKTVGKLRPLLGLGESSVVEIEHRIRVPRLAPELSPFGREALDTHPAYRLHALLAEVAGKRSSLARASRWEDISVGVALEEERSVDAPVGIGRDRFLGVSVSIPLPVRGRHKGLERESLSILAQRQSELAARSLELLNAAASLREEVLSLYRQASHYETNITPLVERNHKEMAEAYSAGQISLNELFRSQSQRLKIQSAHLEMVRDYEQAWVEWKAATARNL